MRRLAITVILALAACGGDDNAAPGGGSGAGGGGAGGGSTDAAAAGSDSSTTSDGSTANDAPSVDDSPAGDATPSDGSPKGDANACALSLASPTGRYVANSITLPTTATEFAFDLNGDGKLDDRFGSIVQVFEQQGIDLQTAMSAAVQGGQMILLVAEVATDATFTATTCAKADVGRAKNLSSAVLDGGGVFVADPTAGTSSLMGSIAASVLQADIGRPATVPPSVRMVLPFGSTQVLADGGTTPLPEVPVTPVHITFKHNATTGLTEGQVNGFITDSDVQTKLLPSIAASLSASVAADPTSPTSKQMLQIFDNGGEANCATANDGIIATCEVATNAIVKALFAPDVQMFSHGDAGSAYDPSVANTQKDSLSIGLGFTAVPATF